MQAAHLPYQRVAGPQVQVIGIAELNLATHLPQVKGGDSALDGRLGPHVHEDGGLDNAAVSAGELAAPGAALGFENSEHGQLLLI